MPSISSNIQKELSTYTHCYIEDSDPQTIVFAYSKDFDDTSILPVIRLEIGALAAWTPTEAKLISPYAADIYPNLFEKPETSILTVLPKRTFWKK